MAGVQQLIEYLESLTFNENDISMLQVADISYAVGNAVSAVKAVAMRQTVNCEDGAIARIIEELVCHH